ncbi:NAD(P)-dependent alcohol dehydrogenase [Microbacterium sp. JZ31]|uniref:NAD(P)-dependent alcohol dehydrogenase n=1 Tax=Microbacterium sp. JZ31 TaxID=1906274 RepID=UPI001933C768|nr:NAD(P)-dependent alcohol dehydrogenase [Microbacterium sp. JZ31]
MRAVLRDAYGGPEVLRVGEVATPRPGPGEVLVRVRASSLNTADLDQLRGLPRIARVEGVRRPRSPHMGLDVAGEVEEVGSGVRDLERGDRVWADLFSHGHAALADYVRVPADASSRIPDGVSFVDAATVPHSGLLALQGLRAAAPFRAGTRVLINGAGGCVGPFAIQLAVSRGAHVTGVDSADKADLMRAAGAHEVIDYVTEDVTRSGKRYDVVLDIADTRGILAMRRCLKRGGRYSLIARRLGSFARYVLAGPLVGRLTGTRMGTILWKPNRRAYLDEFVALLAAGEVRPLIDSTWALDDAVTAFEHLASGRARGKVVVVP